MPAPSLSDPDLWQRIAAHNVDRPYALNFTPRFSRDFRTMLRRLAIEQSQDDQQQAACRHTMHQRTGEQGCQTIKRTYTDPLRNREKS